MTSHSRHEDIGEHERDRFAVRLELRQSILSGLGLENPVAMAREDAPHGNAHGGFVIDDEQRVARRRTWCRQLRDSFDHHCVELHVAWQIDVERRALAQARRDRNHSLGLLNDRIRGRQAESCAVPWILRCEEGLEQKRERGILDADSIVSHAQPHVLAQRNVGLAWRAGNEALIRRLDRGRSATGHRVVRVGEKVEQHLLHLTFVNVDEPELVGERELHVDSSTDVTAQHCGHATEDTVDVDRAGPDDVRAAEGEELASERGAVAHRAVDLLEVLPVRILGREAVEQELGVAAHRREEVVHVVRHPSRQSAHRLQLLLMKELGLEALPLSDVRGDGTDRERLLLVVAQGKARDQEDPGLAVDGVRLFVRHRRAAGEHTRVERIDGAGGVGCQDLSRAPSQNLCRIELVQSGEERIHHQIATLKVLHDDERGQVIDHCAQKAPPVFRGSRCIARGAELRLELLVERPQPAGHQIERKREAPDLIACADRCGGGEVPACHRMRGGGDLANGASDPAGHEREPERERERAQQSRAEDHPGEPASGRERLARVHLGEDRELVLWHPREDADHLLSRVVAIDTLPAGTVHDGVDGGGVHAAGSARPTVAGATHELVEAINQVGLTSRAETGPVRDLLANLGEIGVSREHSGQVPPLVHDWKRDREGRLVGGG